MKHRILEPDREIISLSSVAAKARRTEYLVLFVQSAQVSSTKFYRDPFSVEFVITNHATTHIYQGDIICSDNKFKKKKLFCVQFMVSIAFRFVPAAHIFHIGSVQRVHTSQAEGNFCMQDRLWRP
jgi:hypothetical protein